MKIKPKHQAFPRTPAFTHSGKKKSNSTTKKEHKKPRQGFKWIKETEK